MADMALLADMMAFLADMMAFLAEMAFIAFAVRMPP
jgi:hypothetical protein